MKLVAGRSQDWTDIDLLIAACAQLDEQRILEWSTEFCTMLDVPERLEELRHKLGK